MFCLLVLMCLGERLDEPAVRAIEDAERAWLLYISHQMTVFFFVPSVTRQLFRARPPRRDLFVPLNNKRRQLKESASSAASETTFQHSYLDTLLDVTLPAEDGSGGTRHLTDDEIVALCSEFLNAGTNTTSTGLQWIMAELVKNPGVQAKLHAAIASTYGADEEAVPRMPYLKAVVLEGLRKHPPGHFVLPHKVAEDMDVGGYRIPKGATVNFMVAEMGRDGTEWKNPMEFEPERFLEGGDGVGVDMTRTKGIRMMSFGVRRRICAWLNIAMLHLEYFVANMVKEFEWKKALGHEVCFEEKREFTTVMKEPLRPLLIPRN